MYQGSPLPNIPLLLDTNPNAAFAYSLRKLRTAYAGSAVRIRRVSDNVELDVGFSGPDFDAAGAASFIGGSSGTIVTWYDQSGHGLDATQATAGNQPAYSASGLSSLPTATFDGTNDNLGTASFNLTTYLSSQATVFVVAQVLNADAIFYSWQQTFPTNQFQHNYINAAGAYIFDMGDAGGVGRLRNDFTTFDDGTPHIHEHWRDNADLQGIMINGVLITSATITPDLTSGSATMLVGREAAGGQLMHGQISELVAWGRDLG